MKGHYNNMKDHKNLDRIMRIVYCNSMKYHEGLGQVTQTFQMVIMMKEQLLSGGNITWQESKIINYQENSKSYNKEFRARREWLLCLDDMEQVKQQKCMQQMKINVGY